MSDYLIDLILPCNKIHLLAGISSAGKTRWAIPSLMMFDAAMPVLGLKSHPVPWCMVCRDRPLSDAQDSITRMGFNVDDVKIIPAFGAYRKPDYLIFEEIKKIGAKFVFWEGFDFMVKNPSSHGEVENFLNGIAAYCDEGLTILGTVGVAKLKPHETYENPRQLIAGSTVWERVTSTNMIVQPIDPLDIGDPRRLLHVSLKNDKSFVVAGKFDDNGLLVFDGHDQREKGSMIAQEHYSKRAAAWDKYY